MNPPSRIDEEIAAVRSARLNALRTAPRDELMTRHPLVEEQIVIAGVRVTITTYVECYPDDRLLVLVRSDRSRLFGMISFGATDGFWVLANGAISEATDSDVLDYFG